MQGKRGCPADQTPARWPGRAGASQHHAAAGGCAAEAAGGRTGEAVLQGQAEQRGTPRAQRVACDDQRPALHATCAGRQPLRAALHGMARAGGATARRSWARRATQLGWTSCWQGPRGLQVMPRATLSCLPASRMTHGGPSQAGPRLGVQELLHDGAHHLALRAVVQPPHPLLVVLLPLGLRPLQALQQPWARDAAASGLRLPAEPLARRAGTVCWYGRRELPCRAMQVQQAPVPVAMVSSLDPSSGQHGCSRVAAACQCRAQQDLWHASPSTHAGQGCQRSDAGSLPGWRSPSRARTRDLQVVQDCLSCQQDAGVGKHLPPLLGRQLRSAAHCPVRGHGSPCTVACLP